MGLSRLLGSTGPFCDRMEALMIAKAFEFSMFRCFESYTKGDKSCYFVVFFYFLSSVCNVNVKIIIKKKCICTLFYEICPAQLYMAASDIFRCFVMFYYHLCLIIQSMSITFDVI